MNLKNLQNALKDASWLWLFRGVSDFNGFGLGDVAVTECQIEVQNLKFRTICQTKNKTAI
jgi:hypothetical protein